MALAFLAGLANWVWLGRREKRSLNVCADLLFWIMVGGIAGARVAYVLSDLRAFLEHPVSILRVDQGGLIYYGGFLGAVAAVAIYARRHREPLLKLGDFVITSLPLGHALGRIGCYANGCCFGRPHDGPFSVTYPAQSAPWWSQVYAGTITRFAPSTIPVHPVQLYEAAFDLLLYAVLVLVYRRGRADGRVTAAYLLLYSAWRFWAETLRGDERVLWLGLSVAQVLSMALFVAGCGFLLLIRVRRHAAD